MYKDGKCYGNQYGGIHIIHNGIYYSSLIECLKAIGMSKDMFYYRINKLGMTQEEALSIPSMKNKRAWKKHGEWKTRLFARRASMLGRCYTKSNPSYSNYGGRGIVVCDEWKNDFTKFRDRAYSNGYDDNLSIERINVNGNYCPENCTRIPINEQRKNKRSVKMVEYNNEILPISELAKRLGIPRTTLELRYKKMGDIYKAIAHKRNARYN